MRVNRGGGSRIGGRPRLRWPEYMEKDLWEMKETEGSRNGRMGECNYGGEGRQKVVEPKS